MIGDNIKALMKERNITQLKLAQSAGISQSALSDILRNRSAPKDKTLAELARALNVTTDTLCDVDKCSQSIDRCPRCGSRLILEWHNREKDSYRLRCGFCEIDTGELSTFEKACQVFNSFKHAENAEHANAVRVLTLDELLDVGEYDDDDVRPVWFENRGLFIVASLLRYGATEREQNIVRVEWHNGRANNSFTLDQYGAWWRCWSKKPIQAISDSIPWESDRRTP